MKKTFLSIILLSLLSSLELFGSAQGDKSNGYTIIAGRAATTNGAVLLGHNEDSRGEQLVGFQMIPQRNYRQGELINIGGKATIEQVSSTPKYFWLEMVYQGFSDVFLNQYGVAILSNRCDSREDKEDFSDGGIDSLLSRLVTERAKTAIEAVELIGNLIQRYGYNNSGRTYSIADRKEAWIVSVVQGRRWIAQRVADDEVMIIPNYYTIDKIDLEDMANFRGSGDIISYAEERGWYDVERDGEFSFKKVYSAQKLLNSDISIGRHWIGLKHLASQQYNLTDDLPSAFVPKTKLNVKILTEILTNHYEGTELRVGSRPHQPEKTICNENTAFSVIFDLREIPANIGAVMWLAMSSPCHQVYIPWYIGTSSIPYLYQIRNSTTKALDGYSDTKIDLRKKFPHAMYWDFMDYTNYINGNDSDRSAKCSKKMNQLQAKIFKSFDKFDKIIYESYIFFKLRGIAGAEEIFANRQDEFTIKHHRKLMKIVRTGQNSSR